jgi:transposase-like protein
MEDYPRTLMELESRFSTDEACREYLVPLRWPNGFVCPHCSHATAWPVGKFLWECADCHRQTSVTAGTIFDRSRLPLPVWFRAIWWVVTQKNGASALGLQRVLGIGNYRTAWTWLHKIRHAMVVQGRSRLTGEIEVDETYLGGLEEGVSGRETYKKARVAIAAQIVGKKIGRIRMRRIPDVSTESLTHFISESIEPGSTVFTDGWQAYAGMTKLGYVHKATVLRKSTSEPNELLPRVHRVASLLKRWILGTHQGAVSPEHLDGYLAEFTFRFNRRTSTHRGKLFYRLLQNAMTVEPAPYKKIIKGIRKSPEF